MAEYYGKSYSSIARNRRRSSLGLLLDVMMGVVSLCVVVLFVATLFVPVLDPREWGEVSTLGLIAPFVYSAQASWAKASLRFSLQQAMKLRSLQAAKKAQKSTSLPSQQASINSSQKAR